MAVVVQSEITINENWVTKERKRKKTELGCKKSRTERNRTTDRLTNTHTKKKKKKSKMKNEVHSSTLTAAVPTTTDLCYCWNFYLFFFVSIPGWFAICSNGFVFDFFKVTQTTTIVWTWILLTFRLQCYWALSIEKREEDTKKHKHTHAHTLVAIVFPLRTFRKNEITCVSFALRFGIF